MTQDNIFKWLYSLQSFGIKLGLHNILAIMECFGNPHKNFRTIHVAGTNGKGSTSVFLASIFAELGLKTGLYTSPHLVHFEERIRINGKFISKDEAVSLIAEIKERMPAGLQLTFFEFATAMAFIYFSRKGVDIAIIETGMGGRFDATNIITPLVSLITNISMEHTEYLGNTIEEITMEKCGIIKGDTPVITGSNDETAISVIAEKSDNLYVINKDFCIRDGYYSGKKQGLLLPRLKLKGTHQFNNLACALKAVEILDEMNIIKWNPQRIAYGAAAANWQGRLEVVSQKPFIIIDGAHNPACARVLADYLKDNLKRRVIFVIGIMKDKDIISFLKELNGCVKSVITTAPDYDRAMPPLELEKVINVNFPTWHVIKYGEERSVKNAIEKAVSVASFDDDAICITGSLFTIGEAVHYFSSSQE